MVQCIIDWLTRLSFRNELKVSVCCSQQWYGLILVCDDNRCSLLIMRTLCALLLLLDYSIVERLRLFVIRYNGFCDSFRTAPLQKLKYSEYSIIVYSQRWFSRTNNVRCYSFRQFRRETADRDFSRHLRSTVPAGTVSYISSTCGTWYR